ncbi:MAG: ATP-binding protein [Eubacteriales bacterium]
MAEQCKQMEIPVRPLFTVAQIDDDGKRQDKPEYPIKAVREAILNALMHADTRNQTLTHILEVQKTAENRYSGIPTMQYEMKRMGLCEPEFRNRRGVFTVILKNSSLREAVNGECTTEKMSTTEGLISYCKTPRTRAALAEFLGRTKVL